MINYALTTQDYSIYFKYNAYSKQTALILLKLIYNIYIYIEREDNIVIVLKTYYNIHSLSLIKLSACSITIQLNLSEELEDPMKLWRTTENQKSSNVI